VVNVIIEILLKFEYFWHWVLFLAIANFAANRFPSLSYYAMNASQGAWLIITDPKFPSPEARAEMGTTVTIVYLIAAAIVFSMALKAIYF
jgi:hypothetical protein